MVQPDPLKINISLLQTFHLVAKLGSFSAASRALGISYQSAANHVRKVEQIYGSKLIETDRGSRKVVLSPQGKALYASLSGELDNILSRIALLLQNQRSVLRVGVPQALFHHFFPAILQSFKRHAPSMELAFFERDTVLATMMLDGSLDAAVSERSFGQDAITQHLLGQYHLSLIYPRTWAPPGGAIDSLSQFAERDMISYESGQAIRVKAVDYLSDQFGHQPRINVTASGSTSIVQLVAVGLGYAVVPEWMVEPNNPTINQIVLHQIKPMSVYFAHTALLTSNAFVIQLHQTCAEVMGARLMSRSDVEALTLPPGSMMAPTASRNPNKPLASRGKQIVEDLGVHDDQFSDLGTMEVAKPGWYPLSVDFFERNSTWTLRLLWRLPGADGELAPVPAAALAH